MTLSKTLIISLLLIISISGCLGGQPAAKMAPSQGGISKASSKPIKELHASDFEELKNTEILGIQGAPGDKVVAGGIDNTQVVWDLPNNPSGYQGLHTIELYVLEFSDANEASKQLKSVVDDYNAKLFGSKYRLKSKHVQGEEIHYILAEGNVIYFWVWDHFMFQILTQNFKDEEVLDDLATKAIAIYK